LEKLIITVAPTGSQW